MWERWFALVDLKRKFPSLGSREDEELFQDRGRMPKKIKTNFSSGRLPLKLRTPRETEFGSPIIEPMMKPKDRYAQIQAAIDQELAKRKQEDHGWEDLIDVRTSMSTCFLYTYKAFQNPYQPSPAAYASRCFKFYPASQPPPTLSSDDEDERPTFRACRARFGRGGRMHVDRRIPGGRRLPSLPTRGSDDENSEEDRQRRLEEQWRFDDGPAFGPAGQEEQDRKLANDFSQSYLVRRCSLMNEPHLQHLFKDTSVPLATPDGRVQNYVTYHLGVQPVARNIPLVRRANPSPLTPGIASMRHPNGSLSISSSSSGVGQAKMPPGGMQQVRISSANGLIRPPGTPVLPALPTQASPLRNASPAVNENGHDGVNGEQNVKMANVTVPHAPSRSQPDSAHVQSDGSTPTIPISSPMRLKMTPIPNGFTNPSVQNYNSHIATGVYAHVDGTFQGNGHVALGRANTNYANAAFSQQLIAARQMLWATIPQGNQRPATTLVDATMNSGVETTLAANLGMNVNLPARAPSTNGQQQAGLARGVQSPALAQAIATQGQGRVSPANVARLSHPTHILSPGMAGAQPHQSPARAGQAPMASPSLQSQVSKSSERNRHRQRAINKEGAWLPRCPKQPKRRTISNAVINTADNTAVINEAPNEGHQIPEAVSTEAEHEVPRANTDSSTIFQSYSTMNLQAKTSHRMPTANDPMDVDSMDNGPAAAGVENTTRVLATAATPDGATITNDSDTDMAAEHGTVPEAGRGPQETQAEGTLGHDYYAAVPGGSSNGVGNQTPVVPSVEADLERYLESVVPTVKRSNRARWNDMYGTAYCYCLVVGMVMDIWENLPGKQGGTGETALVPAGENGALMTITLGHICGFLNVNRNTFGGMRTRVNRWRDTQAALLMEVQAERADDQAKVLLDILTPILEESELPASSSKSQRNIPEWSRSAAAGHDSADRA
ncbi:hypothetical protein EIP86_009975 [Pleurotus ostreatoroseus]|nr:hypothetical protein EIP86_009975 [Pleurotus ostreatoroseus]